ncbi:MAG: hypothetical protein KC635_06830, partial [Myxococcales bacterium]|nr:hypothetical protein [Myxococcales bacterium]
MASTRRAFPRRAAALAALAVVSAAATARAADVNPALVEPTLAPGGIWAVGTTPTPTALAVWGELAATFANDELATRTADGVTAGPLRNRLVTTLIAGMALPEVLDVAVGVPLDVVEVPGADGARDGEVALGDVRLEARARLLTPAPSAGGLGLAVAVEASFPTGGSAPFATEGGVTVTPRLVLAWHAPGGGAVALNAGFRVRPGADVVDLAIGNELRVGIGGEIPLGHYGLALLAEVDGAVGFGDSARDPSGVDARKLPLEALGGLRFRPSDAVAISAGVGAGLSEGYGAADWRALLSVSIGAPTGAADAAPVDLDADPVGPDPVGAGPDGPPGDVGPGTPPDDADPGVPALPLPGEPGSPEALANAADPDADTDGVPLG